MLGLATRLDVTSPWRGAARSAAAATSLRKASATKSAARSVSEFYLASLFGSKPADLRQDAVVNAADVVLDVVVQRCRPSSEMSSSMLPTILGDVVVNAADHPRSCRRHRCPPYLEMPSSSLPTLLGDVVVTAADLTRRCRRHCCQPSSKMPS